ncbi:HNH endonuclease signature motif containing protein [Mycolicibacterium vaccae]|uniref:HNH endonuclease signature motif containing protein n=1 Tax=Mycolicibacterium vaccae TaxID=1810 RepID=UPI003CFE894C
MYVRSMSGGELASKIAALRTAFEDVAACEVDLLTGPELVAALDELEELSCQLPAVGHRLLARLQTEATPQKMGAKSWKEVLTVRWRISGGEANRRLGEAAVLAPRPSVTGPVFPPQLPATALAQSRGWINPEHVEVIRRALAKVPGWVDPATREKIEVDLVRNAIGNGPKELKDAAEQTLFLLDQDGAEPDDAERARKRSVSISKQGHDAMSAMTAQLTPEARAVWEAIFAKYAALGMCNPDDPEPCTSGTPSQAQIDNDHRSLAQRQHDALVAVGRIALMSGELGQLNGLPVSVIIRTTLQDLESRAGVGVTGGGNVLPISEVIRMAGHANHYLAVFDRATGSALDLFRTRRVASPAQRIMLIARDGGCTKPCCTVGAYGSQVHHVTADWANGGNTNIDELGLACGPHNRSVDTEGGWSTRMNERCEVEWIPPPGLDTGQARVNNYHRPERLLRPPEEPEPLGDSPTEPTESVVGDAETGQPTPADGHEEPGGPAPPDNEAA